MEFWFDVMTTLNDVLSHDQQIDLKLFQLIYNIITKWNDVKNHITIIMELINVNIDTASRLGKWRSAAY